MIFNLNLSELEHVSDYFGEGLSLDIPLTQAESFDGFDGHELVAIFFSEIIDQAEHLGGGFISDLANSVVT